MTDTSTAIERVEAQDLQERKRLNRMLAAADVMAHSSLLREDLRKDSNARTVAITLDQLGVPPTINNMNACYVIKGAVGMMTWLWCSVASALGGHEVWLDEASDAEVGIAHLRRADTGTVRTVRFTIDDARRAGLLDGANRDTYAKWTTDMLGWRALSRVIKRYAPEVMAGLAGAGAIPEPLLPPPAGGRPQQYLVGDDQDDDVVDGEIVDQGEDTAMPADPETGEVAPPAATEDEVYARRHRHANAAMGEVGVKTDDGRHELVGTATGGATRSTGRLTAWQVEAIVAFCDRLKAAETDESGGEVENAGAAVVGASTAPPSSGPVIDQIKAMAKAKGVTHADLLRKAQELAASRGLPAPGALSELDELTESDLADWLGE